MSTRDGALEHNEKIINDKEEKKGSLCRSGRLGMINWKWEVRVPEITATLRIESEPFPIDGSGNPLAHALVAAATPRP